MAWGILFTALSLFGMCAIMIAYASQADEPPPDAGAHPLPEEMKKAA
jgi:hypothetical protein